MEVFKNLSRRQEKGLKLFREGQVILDYWDDELIIFTILGGSDTYLVSIYQDYMLCLCHDYLTRWQKWPGSFICKHCFGAFLLLTYLLTKKIETIKEPSSI